MRELIDKMGGRKFTATVVLFLVSTLMFFVGKPVVITFAEWSSFQQILLGIFVGGNAISKIANEVPLPSKLGVKNEKNEKKFD